MESICHIGHCTGCWACVNICPVNCISMKEGKLLHLYPKVNIDKCIRCGRCVSVCPENHHCDTSNIPKSAYAAVASNKKEYLTSTSGGIASVLARSIINKGGIVYGAANVKDCEVHHVRITDEEGILSMKGSKYVQSSVDYALSLIHI